LRKKPAGPGKWVIKSPKKKRTKTTKTEINNRAGGRRKEKTVGRGGSARGNNSGTVDDIGRATTRVVGQQEVPVGENRVGAETCKNGGENDFHRHGKHRESFQTLRSGTMRRGSTCTGKKRGTCTALKKNGRNKNRPGWYRVGPRVELQHFTRVDRAGKVEGGGGKRARQETFVLVGGGACILGRNRGGYCRRNNFQRAHFGPEGTKGAEGVQALRRAVKWQGKNSPLTTKGVKSEPKKSKTGVKSFPRRQHGPIGSGNRKNGRHEKKNARGTRRKKVAPPRVSTAQGQWIARANVKRDQTTWGGEGPYKNWRA